MAKFATNHQSEVAYPLQGLISRPEVLPRSLEPATVLSLNEMTRSYPLRADVLLRKFYDVLVECFPEQNEVRPFEAYEEALMSQGHFKVDVLVMHDRVVGGAMTSLVDTGSHRYGVTEYICISREFRGLGLGDQLNTLLNQRMLFDRADAVVQEIADPRLVSAERRDKEASNGMSPEKRAKFWSSQGVLAIDAPYAQPQLPGCSAPVESDMLTIKPLREGLRGSNFMAIPEYLNLVRSYFSTFLEDVDSDPTYRKIASAAKKLEVVPFIPLEAPRRNFRL